jgi:prepilin-type N-terminal cleavage/methylation domain-containing protein
MRDRRGMTLIELLIAMTIFVVVLGSALGVLSKQLRAFDKNSTDMGMVQNLSFATDLLQQELSLAGANAPDQQPPVVYAGANSFIFNADYASNTDSISPAYYNPGLPAGQVDGLIQAQKFTLPGTTPAFAYPDTTYYARGSTTQDSPAETIAWYFAIDTSDHVNTTYVLYRQVNNQAPEPVVRNITQTAGTNFFRYYYQKVPAAGTSAATLDTIPTASMPLKHTDKIHGSSTDVGAAALIDSLARVEVSFTIINGAIGSAARSRSITFSVPLPNLGTRAVVTCGNPPILGTALNANWVIKPGPDTVMVLTWGQATDETTGEKDVRAYVVWRRAKGATDWGDPIETVPAGSTTPTWTDVTAQPIAPGYDYALAAQDCTPSLSTLSTASPVVSP